MSQQGPPSPAADQYLAVMTRIRLRFETIAALNLSSSSGITDLETAAFHMRKIIEGIAFGCMIALQNGLKDVPRDAQGQWNADTIFARLAKRDKLVYPEPFRRENPPVGEDARVSHHIVPVKEKHLSVDQLRGVYQRLHVWLHEWNPYVQSHVKDFDRRRSKLLEDVNSVREFIWFHLIGIGGKVFLGLLNDPGDGQVRVVSAETASLDNVT